MENKRFKVWRLSSATNNPMEYLAWHTVPGWLSFTINDGRTPGKTSELPADEFWRQFMSKVQYGIRPMPTPTGVLIPENKHEIL